MRSLAQFRPVLMRAVVLATAIGMLSPCAPAEDAPKPDAKKPDAPADDTTKTKDIPQSDVPKVQPKRETLSGKVVFLTDALKKRGVKAYEEEMKGQVVLETRTGELWPILSDWRGRAFYQDARLRDRPVDLVVLRDPGVPYLRVQSIYTFDEHGVQQLTDYWCEICSIPMFEIKECECCQGPIRLRYRKKGQPAELAPLTPESDVKEPGIK